MSKKFQRTKFRAYVKLGKKQRSKQKYRRATGRHNKTRQKWKSRPPRVEIGYKNKAATRGLIKGKIPVLVDNISKLKEIKKEQIAIIGKIGRKKKIELIKEAERLKIRILNVNIKKFLRKAARIEKHMEKLKKEEISSEKNKKKEEKKEKGKEEEKSDEKEEDKTEHKHEEKMQEERE